MVKNKLIKKIVRFATNFIQKQKKSYFMNEIENFTLI